MELRDKIIVVEWAKLYNSFTGPIWEEIELYIKIKVMVEI